MKKTLTILDFLTVLPAEVALTDRQPREADARLAKENGRTMRRIKFDDSCCEINGYDAGRHQIGVSVQPATAHLIEFDYEIDDDDRLRPDRG